MSSTADAPASAPRPKAPAQPFGDDNTGCLVKAALGCLGLLVLSLVAGGVGIWWVWSKTVIPADEARERAAQVLELTLPDGMAWRGGFESQEHVFFIAGDHELDEESREAFFLVLFQVPDKPEAWRRDKIHVGKRGEAQAVASGSEELLLHGEPIEARWTRYADGGLDYDVVFPRGDRTVAIYLTGPESKLDAAVFQRVLDSIR